MENRTTLKRQIETAKRTALFDTAVLLAIFKEDKTGIKQNLQIIERAIRFQPETVCSALDAGLRDPVNGPLLKPFRHHVQSVKDNVLHMIDCNHRLAELTAEEYRKS